MGIEVTVITVTYGNRWGNLSKVLEVLGENKLVNKIIVVDNASSYDISSKCKVISEKIDLIKLERNLGSAKGFKVGISDAIKDSCCNFIWIVDDDNLPEPGALESLLIEFKKKQREINSDLFALLSLRTDRKEYFLSSKHKNSARFFPHKNSFLGIHYKDLLLKLIRKVRAKKISLAANETLNNIKVPYAPYGGLFFHKKLVEKIGLPNEDFYLYSDDYEFTYRITNRCNGIYLIPSSKITDVDKSWFKENNAGFLLSILKSNSEMRIFYSIRNRIYFENKDLVDNKFIYKINKSIFYLYIEIMTSVLKRKDRKRLILKAINDGKKGLLGEVKNQNYM